MKRNKWFEDTFLPSFDRQMNNPKYPNRVILSEKQADICFRYMNSKQCRDTYNRYFTQYTYDVGTRHYCMWFAGKYTFLSMHDESLLIWFIRDEETNKEFGTFETENELNKFFDDNLDEDTLKFKGFEYVNKWTTGRRRKTEAELIK